MKTELTQEHLHLAAAVKYLNPKAENWHLVYRKADERYCIADWLAIQFYAEDKNFDRVSWMKACAAAY